MKKLCLIIPILLFLPFVYADTEIFDDWISYGETVTIDGTEYTAFGVGDILNTVLMKSNEYGTVTINLGDSTINGLYTFRYEEKRFGDDDNLNDTDQVVSGKEEEYQFRIEVDKREPDVDIDRSVSEEEVALGQEIVVTVDIENTGDDNVVAEYTDPLPYYLVKDGYLRVTEGTSTQQWTDPIDDSTTAHWKGSIYPTESATLTYTLILESYPPSTFNLTEAEVIYTFEGEDYNITVDEIDLELVEPIVLKISADVEEAEIEDEVTFTFTLNNTMETEEISFNVEVTPPTGSEVTRGPSGFTEESGIYTWSGEYAPSETETYTLKTNLFSSGTNELKVYITNTYEGNDYTKEETESISIEMSELEPTIVVNKESIEGGEEFSISFHVNNPDGTMDYSDVQMDMKSELFEDLQYRTFIGKGINALIKTVELTAPYSDTTQSYLVNFTAEYETEYGEALTFGITETISIAANLVYQYVSIDLEQIDTIEDSALMKATMSLTNQTDISDVSVVFSTDTGFTYAWYVTQRELDQLINTSSIYFNFTVDSVFVQEGESSFDMQLYYLSNAEEYTYSIEKELAVDAPETVEVIETEAPVEYTEESVVVETNVSYEAPVEVEPEEEPEEVVKITTETDTKKKKILTLIGLAVVLLIIVVVGINITKKLRKKKNIEKSIRELKGEVEEEKEKTRLFLTVPKPSYDHKELEDYIKQNKTKGLDSEKIKQKLLKAGWLEDVLDEYLK